jgi:hypothetical protein
MLQVQSDALRGRLDGAISQSEGDALLLPAQLPPRGAALPGHAHQRERRWREQHLPRLESSALPLAAGPRVLRGAAHPERVHRSDAVVGLHSRPLRRPPDRLQPPFQVQAQVRCPSPAPRGLDLRRATPFCFPKKGVRNGDCAQAAPSGSQFVTNTVKCLWKIYI